ncbi:glycosyltransferase family 4 protein [Singulisphaera sp. PoT]|uniref:glycosyltransferase family 4 protein n=1 Tax=Singulisphaera sp. PoT TaxID=3411797 RepID=UPI003BF4AD9C
MAEPTRHILLLAGRLGTHYADGPLDAILDRLEHAGMSVQVLCTSNEGDGDEGDRIIECPGLGVRWQMALAIRRLRLDESIHRPDLLHVIHTEAAPAGLAIAEHWRLPYLQTVDEFLGPHDRLRLSEKWCRRLVPVTSELSHDLSQQFGVPASLMTTIGMGLDVRPVANPPQTDRPRSARVPVIGTAGPLTASSGFSTFLNAARRVLDAGADVEFVIAGEGEDEADLRRRAERLKITDRVTFAGQPVEGLDFWSVLDLFCQTSVVPTVGRSLGLAMAAGVPSIASDIRGLRSLVMHEETGLLVVPNDSGGLANAIISLLRDPDRARMLGQAGQKTIMSRFDPDQEARALATLYQEILALETAGEPRAAVLV